MASDIINTLTIAKCFDCRDHRVIFVAILNQCVLFLDYEQENGVIMIGHLGLLKDVDVKILGSILEELTKHLGHLERDVVTGGLRAFEVTQGSFNSLKSYAIIALLDSCHLIKLLYSQLNFPD